MATCFVIQPFDGGPFDKRYADVFVPAITAAGLEPYRVDQDPAAAIPIEQIEDGIRRADACLADISEPNPNVWFELGYAIAAGKPVVLVCSFKPDRRFPFDVQHRTVITYKTDSVSDFDDLKDKIAARLKAALLKESKLEKLAESSVVANVEGLNPIEIVALATVAENVDDPEATVSTWSIRQDMEKSGYTRIATTLGLASLLKKEMVLSERRQDQNGEDYAVYSVTSRGLQWLFANQERLVLRREKRSEVSPLTDDDIPF